MVADSARFTANLHRLPVAHRPLTDALTSFGMATRLYLVVSTVFGLLEGGPRLMIYVLLVYSVLNVVIQSVIQPKIVGDAVGLSSTITMVSLVFWAYTLGAMGALLAVPLTLFAKALLVDADPGSRWLTPLMSGAAPGKRRWNGPKAALQARRAPRAPAGPRRGGAR